MEKFFEIPLKNGGTLRLNVHSIKKFFDSCSEKETAGQMQCALDAITNVCENVAKKNIDMAQLVMDVATLVMANAEVV
jgi:hypothetical protein